MILNPLAHVEEAQRAVLKPQLKTPADGDTSPEATDLEMAPKDSPVSSLPDTDLAWTIRD